MQLQNVNENNLKFPKMYKHLYILHKALLLFFLIGGMLLFVFITGTNTDREFFFNKHGENVLVESSFLSFIGSFFSSVFLIGAIGFGLFYYKVIMPIIFPKDFLIYELNKAYKEFTQKYEPLIPDEYIEHADNPLSTNDKEPINTNENPVSKLNRKTHTILVRALFIGIIIYTCSIFDYIKLTPETVNINHIWQIQEREIPYTNYKKAVLKYELSNYKNPDKYGNVRGFKVDFYLEDKNGMTLKIWDENRDNYSANDIIKILEWLHSNNVPLDIEELYRNIDLSIPTNGKRELEMYMEISKHVIHVPIVFVEELTPIKDVTVPIWISKDIKELTYKQLLINTLDKSGYDYELTANEEFPFINRIESFRNTSDGQWAYVEIDPNKKLAKNIDITEEINLDNLDKMIIGINFIACRVIDNGCVAGNLTPITPQANTSLETDKKTYGEEKSFDPIFRYGVWHIPLTASYYFELGFEKWAQIKDYETAANYYNKSLQVDSNYAPALSSYGYIIGAFYNRYDEGVDMLNRAMKLDATWEFAPFNLSLLYNLHGDYESAKYWKEYTIKNFSTSPNFDYFISIYNEIGL